MNLNVKSSSFSILDTIAKKRTFITHFFTDSFVSFVDDHLAIVFGRIASTRDFHEIYSSWIYPQISRRKCLFYRFTQKDLPHVILEARSNLPLCTIEDICRYNSCLKMMIQKRVAYCFFWIFINDGLLSVFSKTIFVWWHNVINHISYYCINIS